MALIDTLTGEVEAILDTEWNVRDGNVIPESDAIVLKDGAVKIEATFLYADLAGSSALAKNCPWETTAKIIRAYLNCSVRLIKEYGGEIRSFDGDRVMGIFKGDTPNTNAAKCAREIDWVVEYILNPKAKEKHTSIRKNNINIRHCVGIDTGEAIAVRAGIRNNNDIIWIGRAPSFSAKLSDIRKYPYCVYISKECYKRLNDSALLSSNINIWEASSFDFAGASEVVYRTKYTRKP